MFFSMKLRFFPGNLKMSFPPVNLAFHFPGEVGDVFFLDLRWLELLFFSGLLGQGLLLFPGLFEEVES